MASGDVQKCFCLGILSCSRLSRCQNPCCCPPSESHLLLPSRSLYMQLCHCRSTCSSSVSCCVQTCTSSKSTTGRVGMSPTSQAHASSALHARCYAPSPSFTLWVSSIQISSQRTFWSRATAGACRLPEAFLFVCAFQHGKCTSLYIHACSACMVPASASLAGYTAGGLQCQVLCFASNSRGLQLMPGAL